MENLQSFQKPDDYICYCPASTWGRLDVTPLIGFGLIWSAQSPLQYDNLLNEIGFDSFIT